MSDEQAGEQTPTDRWGESVSPKRRAELQSILNAWGAPGAEHGARKGPFDVTRISDDVTRIGDEEGDTFQLTGADVSWLARLSGRHELERVPDLHLEGANLSAAHLEGANLNEAHLEAPTSTRPTWREPTSTRLTWREPTSTRLTWREPSSAQPTWRVPSSARLALTKHLASTRLSSRASPSIR